MMRSEHVPKATYHCRFNNEHIWEGLYDHFKSKKISTFI